MGVVISAAIYLEVFTVTVLFYILLAALFFSILSLYWKIPLITTIIDLLDRESDKKKLPGKGAIFYLAGALLVTLLFQKDIAAAAVIILGIGDSLSPVLGRFGRIRHPFSRDGKKTLEGNLGAMLAAAVMAYIYLHNPIEAVVGALVGLTVEVFEIHFHHKIDDNLTIPFFSGGAIWLLRFALG